MKNDNSNVIKLILLGMHHLFCIMLHYCVKFKKKKSAYMLLLLHTGCSCRLFY